jgi:hypothetical protein
METPENAVEIQLSGGRVALVEAADAELVSRYHWNVISWGYAIGRVNDRMILMHRLIVGEPPRGLEIDHINRNKLDNRRANLRVCTISQNRANRHKFRGCSSQYKGVSLIRVSNRWSAKIKENGRLRHIGTFDSEVDAARAFDREALRIHGEYAFLNFAQE